MRLLALILSFSVLGVSCKPRVERSELQDLQQGQMLNENPASLEEMKGDRKVVLIFYANDTYAPRSNDEAFQNLEALVGLLRSSAEKEPEIADVLRKTATRLEDDWNSFREVVSQDIRALADRLCHQVSATYWDSVGGMAVFRNFNNDDSFDTGDTYHTQHVRRLRWEACSPGGAHMDTYSMEVPRIKEFPYASQPFSHPLVFEKALEAVKEKFPPASHRYILITKSHGSPNYAMTPHLSVDLRQKIRDNGDEIIEAIKANQEAGLADIKTMQPILADVNVVLASSDKKNPQPDIGVSKQTYLKILNQMSSGSPSQAMKFPIVLMESCKSDLRLSDDPEIKWVLNSQMGASYEGFRMPNIGMLYTSDHRGLGYTDVNYWELKSFRFNNHNDFQDLFKAFLDNIAKK